MAARKLKFKPKPLVTGTVRRGRDNEEVCEVTQKDSSISGEKIKENCTPVVCSNTNLSEASEDKIVNNCGNFKKIKTEHCDSEPVFSDSRPKTIASVSELNNTNGNRLIFNSNAINGIPVNITNEKLAITDEQNSPVLDLRVDCGVGNKETTCKYGAGLAASEVIINNCHTKDTHTYDNSPSKPDLVKGYPRYGRLRCKPVLNNSGPRRNNDVSLNSDSVSNEHYTRTDSVIKCVKAEINNAKTIAAEISDSFSLLEADEPEIFNNRKYISEEPIEISNTNIHEQPEAIENKSCHILSSMTESSALKIPSVTYDRNNDISRVIAARLYKTENYPNDKTEHVETLKENNAENVNINIPNKVPICPLRTSKILVPKPSPRLSDMVPRRISFQGSDSEEEVKWKCSIKMNESKLPTKEKKEKDLKNNKRKRSQGSTYSKMGQDTLEKFTKKFGKDETPDKNKLTMLDLIFYNPKNNPMPVNPQTAPVVTKKEEKIQVDEVLEEVLAEQNVDDVEAAALPVPQLKVGPDGQVMLDPKSLIIETTGMEKSRVELEKSQVIQETGITRYSTYSKRKHQRRDWTQGETIQFYKALSTIGTDFTLMEKLFPSRSRHELKLKFKREEKVNMQLIDKALMSPALFDFKNLERELQEENEEIAKQKRKKEEAKEASRKRRAEKKEEKLKIKDKKKYSVPKATCKPIKDFHESDKGKKHNRSKLVNKSRVNRRKSAHKVEVELLDSELEEELHIDVGSNPEDEEMSILNIVKETCSGRVPKLQNKLEEREELNETLKKKLLHESDSEEDLYTPNGPGAHMLFGSPTHVEEPSQGPDEGHWNIEISALPTIEETVLLNENVEDVSELSELGSFGQNDSVLDLSMPVRANIQRGLLQESQTDTALLNRHIISQSIQIIDQLTANVDSNNLYTVENIKANPGRITSKDVQMEDKMPLPSFESVSRSRPSMMYPFIPADCDSGNQLEDSSNDPRGMVLANLYDTEECILGD